MRSFLNVAVSVRASSKSTAASNGFDRAPFSKGARGTSSSHPALGAFSALPALSSYFRCRKCLRRSTCFRPYACSPQS
jgi:hypothetical protein